MGSTPGTSSVGGESPVSERSAASLEQFSGLGESISMHRAGVCPLRRSSDPHGVLKTVCFKADSSEGKVKECSRWGRIVSSTELNNLRTRRNLGKHLLMKILGTTYSVPCTTEFCK